MNKQDDSPEKKFNFLFFRKNVLTSRIIKLDGLPCEVVSSMSQSIKAGMR